MTVNAQAETWHLYHTPSHQASWGRGGQKAWKSQRSERMRAKQYLLTRTGILHPWTQQHPWLLARDPHKSRAMHILAWHGERLTSPHPSIRNYGQPTTSGEGGELVFFKCVVPGRLTWVKSLRGTWNIKWVLKVVVRSWGQNSVSCRELPRL